MHTLLKLIVERVILGLVETIDIDGVGPVIAKVDSGNELYNVLHGSNISTKPNGTVTFTTVGGQNIEKRVMDRVTINLGDSNTEDRPVVQFNIKFNGKEYKDIPFSIGNRSENTEKVLLGVDFLSILDCLVDPTKK
jgi:hypothetical protein